MASDWGEGPVLLFSIVKLKTEYEFVIFGQQSHSMLNMSDCKLTLST